MNGQKLKKSTDCWEHCVTYDPQIWAYAHYIVGVLSLFRSVFNLVQEWTRRERGGEGR
jgi:hypothetical protein